MVNLRNSVNRKYYLGIAILFAVSRVIYLISGIYRLTGPLKCGYYVAPVALLHQRFWETVLYFHVSPPLYNLFIGLLVKLFPTKTFEAYLLVSHVVGLVLCLGLFSLLLRLKVLLAPALVLTSLFAASPGLGVYVSNTGYTLYCCFLLLFAALFLQRYLREGRARSAAVYFALLAALALLRSTYNLVWFVAFIIVPFLATQFSRKKLCIILLLPYFVVLGWYAQHISTFGYPPHSFMVGKQLVEMAAHGMPKEVLADIISSSNGGISEIPDYCVPRPHELPEDINNIPPTGIPVLDWKYQYERSKGSPNYGYIAYLYLGKRWQRDAIRIILKAPEYFAHNIFISIPQYFCPTEDIQYHDYQQPRSRIERIYEILCGRFKPWQPVIGSTGQVDYFIDNRRSWFLIIGFPFLFIYGCWKAFRNFTDDKPLAITIIFMLGSIFWVTLNAFMLTVGESMRYRFEVDPFYIALLGIFISDGISTLKCLFLRKRDSVLLT